MKARTLLEMIIESIKRSAKSRVLFAILSTAAMFAMNASAALAQSHDSGGHGEASSRLPDLSTVRFQGVNGHKLLLFGLVICALGLLFGLAIYTHLKNLPVHRAMREISELIYETCKTYLITQGKFILILEAF